MYHDSFCPSVMDVVTREIRMKIFRLTAAAATIAVVMSAPAYALNRTPESSQYHHQLPHQVPYYDLVSQTNQPRTWTSATDHFKTHSPAIQHACPNQCR